jgi:hypothetical protein
VHHDTLLFATALASRILAATDLVGFQREHIINVCRESRLVLVSYGMFSVSHALCSTSHVSTI